MGKYLTFEGRKENTLWIEIDKVIPKEEGMNKKGFVKGNSSRQSSMIMNWLGSVVQGVDEGMKFSFRCAQLQLVSLLPVKNPNNTIGTL